MGGSIYGLSFGVNDLAVVPKILRYLFLMNIVDESRHVKTTLNHQMYFPQVKLLCEYKPQP